SHAKASYESINGTIVSDWKLEGRKFTLNVAVPVNTTATVYVPAGSADSVTEGERPAANAHAVRFVRMDQGNAVFATGSGEYQFVSTAP
ncbi:MAG: alpha-L-rhamnosidase C-terminal domain-containing protein, partial [Planctomycetota bacterium]